MRNLTVYLLVLFCVFAVWSVMGLLGADMQNKSRLLVKLNKLSFWSAIAAILVIITMILNGCVVSQSRDVVKDENGKFYYSIREHSVGLGPGLGPIQICEGPYGCSYDYGYGYYPYDGYGWSPYGGGRSSFRSWEPVEPQPAPMTPTNKERRDFR